MIGYVTLGTNDLKKSAAFYDKLCAEMGMARFMATTVSLHGEGRAAARDLASRCPTMANR